MKVEDLREKKHSFEFSDLNIGDVFKKETSYSNWTFMKISKVVEISEIDEQDKEDYNTVCLDDGALCWFEWDEGIIKVEAKVVIEK